MSHKEYKSVIQFRGRSFRWAVMDWFGSELVHGWELTKVKARKAAQAARERIYKHNTL